MSIKNTKHDAMLLINKSITNEELHTTVLTRDSIKQNNNYEVTKNDLIQVIIYMLLNYHFRIGNDKYTKLYDSHAISTLKPCHFYKNNDNIIIKFKGKKGVINKTVETDKKIIYIYYYLIHNCKKNNNEYIFNYNYINEISNKNMLALLSSNSIKEYLTNTYYVNITPKMFRTWYANYHMLDYLKNLKNSDFYKGKTSNKKKLSRYLKKEICEYVSKHLNNTPSITKKNYINNKLFNDVINRPKCYTRCII